MHHFGGRAGQRRAANPLRRQASRIGDLAGIHIGLADGIAADAAGIGHAGQNGRNGAGQIGGKECVGDHHIGQRHRAGIAHRQGKAHQITRAGKWPVGGFAEVKAGGAGGAGHGDAVGGIGRTGSAGSGCIHNAACINVGLGDRPDTGAGPVDRRRGQCRNGAGKPQCGVIDRDIGQGQIAGIAHLEGVGDPVAHGTERGGRGLLVQRQRPGGSGRIDGDDNPVRSGNGGPIRGSAQRGGSIGDAARIHVGLRYRIGARTAGHAKWRNIGAGAGQCRKARIGYHHPGQGLCGLVGDAETIGDGLRQRPKTDRAGFVEQKRWRDRRRNRHAGRWRGNHSRAAGPVIGKTGGGRVAELPRINIGLGQSGKSGGALEIVGRKPRCDRIQDRGLPGATDRTYFGVGYTDGLRRHDLGIAAVGDGKGIGNRIGQRVKIGRGRCLDQ